MLSVFPNEVPLKPDILYQKHEVKAGFCEAPEEFLFFLFLCLWVLGWVLECPYSPWLPSATLVTAHRQASSQSSETPLRRQKFTISSKLEVTFMWWGPTPLCDSVTNSPSPGSSPNSWDVINWPKYCRSDPGRCCSWNLVWELPAWEIVQPWTFFFYFPLLFSSSC